MQMPHALWQGRPTEQGRELEVHCVPALQSCSPREQTAHKGASTQGRKHKTRGRKWGCSERDVIAQSLGAAGCGRVGKSQSFRPSQPSEDRVEKRQSEDVYSDLLNCWATQVCPPRLLAESANTCLDCSATSGLMFIPAASRIWRMTALVWGLMSGKSACGCIAKPGCRGGLSCSFLK